MESEQLNNALLKSAKDEEKSDEEAPRRNSKEDLIKKILEYAEKHQVEVEHSNTRLKRMTKKQLQEYYAFLVETVIRQNMAEQVGARKDATDRVIGLAALRMVHDICATTAESGLNTYLPAYGYEVNGFTDSLKQPQVSEAIDSCLEEIAADSEILQGQWSTINTKGGNPIRLGYSYIFCRGGDFGRPATVVSLTRNLTSDDVSQSNGWAGADDQNLNLQRAMAGLNKSQGQLVCADGSASQSTDADLGASGKKVKGHINARGGTSPLGASRTSTIR